MLPLLHSNCTKTACFEMYRNTSSFLADLLYMTVAVYGPVKSAHPSALSPFAVKIPIHPGDFRNFYDCPPHTYQVT